MLYFGCQTRISLPPFSLGNRSQTLLVSRFTRDKDQLWFERLVNFLQTNSMVPTTAGHVPPERRKRYFLEFAKTHTWDPLITWTVQHHFYVICKRRMKDMVSNARTSRERPNWINETLWNTMTKNWDTEEAHRRSRIYYAARMSERQGIGPHIHLSGPKSYQQIHHEMEEELGRTVTLGEVFIKTHTRPDGTYVDQKAEKIAKSYEKNLQVKLSQLEVETLDDSEAALRPRELSADAYNYIFLHSIEKDSRGTPYGVRGLKHTLVNGKLEQPGDSSHFVALQEKLKEAQCKIEEQATYNERREVEHARVVAEQNDMLNQFSLVEKYMRATDPRFLDFMATHSAAPTT